MLRLGGEVVPDTQLYTVFIATVKGVPTYNNALLRNQLMNTFMLRG